MIRDFTGDGVPDELWKDGDRWHMARGLVTRDGARLDGPEVTWDEPAELSETTTFRFLEPANHQGDAHEMGIVTETWTQFMDWNGDGRLGVIDARGGQSESQWRVWINEDDGQGGVHWRATQVSVFMFRAYQYTVGLDNILDSLRGRLFPDPWHTTGRAGRTRPWGERAAGRESCPISAETVAVSRGSRRATSTWAFREIAVVLRSSAHSTRTTR
ncbi:MAG: hypothetical protein IPL61_17115 [Myxococcales bacterium]|nr:hypothetical protein [Myxococcales bacterium]